MASKPERYGDEITQSLALKKKRQESRAKILVHHVKCEGAIACEQRLVKVNSTQQM
jgi:hypothetical protein